MMSTQNSHSLVADSDVTPLEYTEIEDMELRITLQRCEERILSYTRSMTDTLLGMAKEFHEAKKAIDNQAGFDARQSPLDWTRWVARLKISKATADRLAKIGELEYAELEALRTGVFAESGGISGIAAYLNAPEEVQEKIKAGEVGTRDRDIQAAARAYKEAQEAQKRAEEAEARAREVEASVKSRIEEAQARARLDGELKLQEATARLRREVDDAQHQAAQRTRDVEEAQQKLRLAQAEWQQRLREETNKATQEQKAQLERTYNERMRDLQKQIEYQQRTAEAAKKQAEELNDQLVHGRNSEAIRARWQMTAETLTGQALQAMGKFPSVIDVHEFGAEEWRLLESLRHTLRTAEARLAELATPNAAIVDADG